MLFAKYRVSRWMRRVEYYKIMAEMAESAHESREVSDRLWRRHNYYGRKVYNYQHKRWYAQARKDLKEAHPYGAFYAIPQMMFDLIQRCYEYWMGGYNVWTAEDSAAPIREQVTHAWNLVNECMEYWKNNDFDFPQDKLIKLFTYVAEHVHEWGD